MKLISIYLFLSKLIYSVLCKVYLNLLLYELCFESCIKFHSIKSIILFLKYILCSFIELSQFNVTSNLFYV